MPTAATVTVTEYGYSITGGDTATTINSGRIWVKAMAFAANATNATCVLTSIVAGTATTCFKFKAYDAGGGSLNAAGNFIYFGESGVPFTGLALTPSATTDILYIFLTRH